MRGRTDRKAAEKARNSFQSSESLLFILAEVDVVLRANKNGFHEPRLIETLSRRRQMYAAE